MSAFGGYGQGRERVSRSRLSVTGNAIAGWPDVYPVASGYLLSRNANKRDVGGSEGAHVLEGLLWHLG